MITMQIIIVIGCFVWLPLGLFFWALIHGGKDAQADIEEPGDSYVDQDGETFYPDHDAWKHASVKVPHADSSAATFHRAER